MRILHVAECIGGVDRYLQSLLKYSTYENIMILSQLYKDKKVDYEKIASHVEIMRMEHGMKASAVGEAIELRKKIKKYNIYYFYIVLFANYKDWSYTICAGVGITINGICTANSK